jgi:hypothetical protein
VLLTRDLEPDQRTKFYEWLNAEPDLERDHMRRLLGV